ncbi:hypothetical protein QBC40DRAFT_289182 [Triangularia verruculosa]|uniref:Uncharacterized protein n=1 Tax=Triangularia verruculosa TaxID=2587418 RepID=A0AAN7ARW7_9PEZI|nr:hypothetical protein QBC40DRAFT_289182 [Triangularia verruculosa]
MTASRYNALPAGQANDETSDPQGQQPPFSPDSFASRLSPTSQSTSTSLLSPGQSPNPMAHVSLAEKTFTPLSMNDSDYLSDHSATDRLLRKKSSFSLEHESMLSTSNTSRAESFLQVGSAIVRSNSVSSTSSATAAGRGVTVVSTMVQSFEALHAAAVEKEKELALAAKKSSASLRPSLDPSSRTTSPALNAQQQASVEGLDSSLGAVVGATNTTIDEKEDSSVPQNAAACPDAERPAQEPKAPESPARLPTSVTAQTPLVRPTPTTISSPTSQIDSPLPRTSSTASIGLTHPTPDINKRSQSGAFLGNIAALEATAERLSMTSSIEAAIREEHNELKRSESRRSSILQRARGASAGSDSGSALHLASRKNSVVETNNAARFGGYVMSPRHSLSGASARLRSGSKASSVGVPGPESVALSSSVENGEDFPFMSRSGPGKASTRSAASKLSLAEIAELEHPTALTRDAMDRADSGVRDNADEEEERRILASARQYIEPEFADEVEGMRTPQNENYSFLDEPVPRLQLHQPDQYSQYWDQNNDQAARPMTAASVNTFDQAQAAFGDFDGVHCDPEVDQFVPHQEPELPRPPQQPQLHAATDSMGPRPTSYFDPSTGQQMLYYPAPVPAMLNLPPKLSKKPKAGARTTRRSQVLSAMPMPTQESRVWLPDPTEGLGGGSQLSVPLMPELLGGDYGSQTPNADELAPPLAPALASGHARHASEASTIHPAAPVVLDEQREFRRPQRLTDNRKSRATVLDGLPPQLRASAFFELPSTHLSKIEVKDGSAMATLDSILDASAAAPVSAFTDHAFAGTLGDEVYGAEKKRKSKKLKKTEAEAVEEEVVVKPKRKTLVKRNSSSALLAYENEPKKRSSRFSLFPSRGDADDSSDDDDERVRRNGARSPDDAPLQSPNPLAPGADEESSQESSEESGDDERSVYKGPPTTLLAELQIRKRQNQQRVKDGTQLPRGQHGTTLLELDAVAQVEQRTRKGKRVNLAWEDPNANPYAHSDTDDEDVPLGMLALAKATGDGNNRSTMDISVLMSEVNRPLGLMERREIEDNEPLSRRRQRLQGRDDGQVPLSLDVIQKRMSHMPLAQTNGAPVGLMGLRSQSRLTLPLAQEERPGSMMGAGAEDSDPEGEGETLAARKARLAAENPLPRTRPVSGMFSAELLSQFGGGEDEASDIRSKGKPSDHSRVASFDVGKDNAPSLDVPEEEETLGQRRRRLQAEREAREREMAAGGGMHPPRAATPIGFLPNSNGLQANPQSRPLSMANMLGAHPIDTPMGHLNPLEQARLNREAEAMRVQQEQELRMAALRAQMPTSLVSVSAGGRSGGYMNGMFNNGMGGQAVGQSGAAGMSLGYGNSSNLSLLAPQQPMMYGGSIPMNGGYGGYGMQMPVQGGQVDMVERWRQGVQP